MDAHSRTGQVPLNNGGRAKLRTSCDSCQAAKVKCGHEKPSCRRCSVQKLECVYSLSRRMGRPRAKKTTSEDATRRQPNVGSDDKIPSKTATPAIEFVAAETQMSVRKLPLLDTGSGEESLSEPTQRPDSWGPMVGDFEPHAQIANDSGMQPMSNSLDFLTTYTPMELDDIPGFTMPSFLVDSSISTDPQGPSLSAPSADFFDSQDLLPTRLPVTNDKDLFSSVDPQQLFQQRHSDDATLVQHTDRFSRGESASSSSNAAPLNQAFDFPFEFLSDFGSTSQNTRSSTPVNTSRHEGGLACPNTIETPRRSACHTSCEEDSWPLSGCISLEDQKRTHCSCIATILQRIGSLKAELQKSSSIPIDSALMMESGVEESLFRLQRCKSCCHDSTVHLLALVSVRMVLELLQKTAHDEFVSRPRRTNSSGAASRSRSKHEASPEFQRSSGPDDGGILAIGNFKVTSKARFRFLRKVLQARFYKLAVLVEEREKLVGGISQDCFARPASLILGDISRALRTLMGWVELWNSKHL